MPTKLNLNTPGARIRMMRTAKGWSQEHLGRLVGASQVAVSHWELDRFTPGLAAQKALADHLGTTRSFLFDCEAAA